MKNHETANKNGVNSGFEEGFIRPDSFVTKEAIARRYGVCQRTIHTWMRSRTMPHYKIGRCVRFKVSECDAAWERFKRECINN